MNANLLNAMRASFEYGFRCCEKGQNLQMAMETFEKQMTQSELPKGQHIVMASDTPATSSHD